MSNRSTKKKIKRLLVNSNTNGSITSFTATNAARTLHSLNELRSSGEFCDVKIQVNDKFVWAHKGILAVNSEYFQAMFTTNMKESQTNVITMDTVDEADFHILENLISFMYTGKSDFDMNDVPSLYVMSDMLQMNEIKESCVEQLISNLCESNCLGMFSFSRQFSIEWLLRKSVEMIKGRFASVVRSQEFNGLDIRLVLEIIQYDDLALGPRKEEEVVYAIIRWLMHEPGERCTLVEQCFPHIRWRDVSEACLAGLKIQEPLRDKTDVWERLEVCRKENKPSRCPPQSVYVIGGYLQSRTGPKCPQLSSVHKLDFSSNPPHWDETPAGMDYLAPHLFAFNIHGKLLCFLFNEEGNTGTYPTLEEHYVGLFEYSQVLNKWEDLSATLKEEHKKKLFMCINNRGFLYYHGESARIHGLGTDTHFSIDVTDDEGDVELGKVEDLVHNSHYEAHDRGDFSVEVIGDDVYAIGGSDLYSEHENFPTAEVYKININEGVWKKMASMNEKRAKCASTRANDNIYALGGYSEYRSRTLERYCVLTNQWTMLASMEKPRTHFSAVTVGNKIIVLGGKSYAFLGGGARKVLKICEQYDISTHTWSLLPGMSQARCQFPAVVM